MPDASLTSSRDASDSSSPTVETRAGRMTRLPAIASAVSTATVD